VLSFFAVATDARPRHRLQPRSRDGLLAGLTNAKGVPVDPRQRLFYRTQKMSIRLMQTDLKLRFSPGTRLVAQIATPTSCGRYRGLNCIFRGRKLVELRKQKAFVSLGVSYVHGRFHAPIFVVSTFGSSRRSRWTRDRSGCDYEARTDGN